MNETKLLELRTKINESTEKVTMLEGRKSVLQEQLVEKYKVSTLKQAKKKSETIQGSIDELNEEIKTATEQLEAQLDEQDNQSEE